MILTRWARLALITVSVLIALVVIAIVLLTTVDLGRFKSNFEQIVTEATGREFVIGGQIDLNVGDTIDLVAEDVRCLAWCDTGKAKDWMCG